MQTIWPLTCVLSVIRPPTAQYENAVLQLVPVDKAKCPYVKGFDIGFHLYTRHNPTSYQELRLGDDERLFASNIDFHDPTVIYFHAFMEQPEDGSGLMIREAYMQRGDTNVIMVDAHTLEAGPWYLTAAQNTWYIGRYAAIFVDYLVSRGLDLNNTHFVGHSLGGQSAGVAGGALKSGRVARITALDPALPLFSGLPVDQRLDITDAKFVDVIHTDAGIFGYKEPLGHVDFFPNSGKSPQPGCELEAVIPQQLLLNKYDGSEKTGCFYTYHLTTNQGQPRPEYQDTKTENSHKKNYLGKHENLKHTNNDDSKTTEPVENTHVPILLISKKVNKHTIEAKYVLEIPNETTHNSNRKKRMERDIHNKDTDNKDNGITKPPKHAKVIDVRHDSSSNLPTTNVHTIENTRDCNNSNTDKEESTKKATETAVKEQLKRTDTHQNPKANDVNSKINTQANTIASLPRNPKLNNEKLNIPNINIRPLALINTLRRITSKFQRIPSTKPMQNAKPRQKRFLQFFRSENNDDNFVFKALNFLVQNRKNIVPVISVMREINTLVKSGNGELSHFTKEQNNYLGSSPPDLAPITYNLELGKEGGVIGFIKRILGFGSKGDSLTIGNGK